MSDYVKTVWIDDTEPDIDAVHLNHLETGVDTAHQEIDAVAVDADAALSSATSAVNAVNSHAARTDNPHAVTARQAGGRHHKNAVKEGAVGNDSTDNTNVLQGILDALRNAGGGELYLPYDPANGHTIYRTKTLHVYSNTRIVSEGATLKAINYGDPRAGVPGDYSYPYGLLSLRDQPNAGYASKPSGITVEGVKLDANTVAVGTDGIRGIFCYADDVRIRDVEVLQSGRSTDCIEIGGTATRVWVERCKLLGARRNCVSVVSGRYVWILDSDIGLCEATAIGGNASPGCGIDVESEGPLSHIHICRNVIHDNGGAGIGYIFSLANAYAPEATGMLAEGNEIIGNGNLSLPFGTKGGIWVAKGQSDGNGTLRIVGNDIRGTIRGAGLQGYDPAVDNVTQDIVLVGNTFKSNAGSYKALPYYTGTLIEAGNITA